MRGWAVLGGLFGRGSSLFQVMLAAVLARHALVWPRSRCSRRASTSSTSARSPAAAQLQADETLKQEAAVANSPIVYVGIVQKQAQSKAP